MSPKHNSPFYKYLLIVFVLFLSGLLYFNNTNLVNGHKLLSLSFLSLIAGLLFESFRISEKWTYVIYIFFGAFLLSFLSFAPGKHEREYIFEEHLSNWPYYFLFTFALISTAFNSNKTTVKLTEGVTLLQSISIIYWVIDYGFAANGNWFVNSLIATCLIFSAFSIFNALCYVALSERTRLWLSIWSSIIMLLFSIDNINRVYNNPDIETTQFLSDSLFIALQYFLLGVSSMYIVQNAIMLLGFLPGKGTFFNRQYFNDLHELKTNHVDRYSDEQVYIGYSIIFMVLTCCIYGINYFYHFVPTYTAIWIVFVIVPIIGKLLGFRNTNFQ